MKVLTLTLLALFALAATPTAVADSQCANAVSETVCFHESHRANGSCTDGDVTGTSGLSYTGTPGAVHVTGQSFCFGMSQFDYTYTQQFIAVDVYTAAGSAHVFWYEAELNHAGSQSSYCTMAITTSATGGIGDGGCPAGGPPSGIAWGQLLP